MFSRIPGLCPLDADSTAGTTKNVPRQCQIPLGEQNHLWSRTTGLYELPTGIGLVEIIYYGALGHVSSQYLGSFWYHEIRHGQGISITKTDKHYKSGLDMLFCQLVKMVEDTAFINVSWVTTALRIAQNPDTVSSTVYSTLLIQKRVPHITDP